MFKHVVTLFFTLAALSIVFSATKAEAAQCIYNESATSLNVKWYNSQNKKDNNSSNANLLFGQKSCQNNSNQGWATIECNGCTFAEGYAKGAVIGAAIGGFGACVIATGGGCAVFGPGLAYGTLELVQKIPPAFKGSLIVIPNQGATATVSGNVFGLSVN